MSIVGMRHVGIVVRDMDRSLPFYRDLLRLEVWADFTDDSEYISELTKLPGARVRMVKLRTPCGVSVELLQYLSHPLLKPERLPSNALGCSHVAFQVDDIERTYAHLVKAGVQFHCPPRISPDGGAKVSYCRDFEDVLIELVEILPKNQTRKTCD